MTIFWSFSSVASLVAIIDHIDDDGHRGVVGVDHDEVSVEADERSPTQPGCDVARLFSLERNGESPMTLDPDRIASLLETAPVGAVARLTLLSSTARHEAAQTVARHLCEGLRRDDRDQLPLPL